MIDFAKPVAEWAATIIELVGVGLLALMVPYVLGSAAIQLFRRAEGDAVIHQSRRRLAGGILLGLEFLIAGDIVRTVVVELNFETVGVLAAIVLVRTFLSITIEVEATGHWPWRASSSS
ncbi:MAG: DUF1622 domain-containing protein [Enhygromyxa sp.]